MTHPGGSKTSVYVGMCADPLHAGHIHILLQAAALGTVTVGLLTDNAMRSYKGQPLIPFEHRLAVVSQLRGVHSVVPQETLDYSTNLKRLRPMIVVHGDDWKSGVQSDTRAKVVQCLEQWGGRLVEPAYTEGVCSSDIKARRQT